jgi:hypothetical protein
VTSDNRITPGLIYDVADALERHGYFRSDDQHADRAIGLLGDLARIYEGTQEYPAGAYLVTAPSSLPAHPGPSGQAGQDAVILAGGDVSTVLAALDVAGDHNRDRAEMCADCADQSCPTCQSRLRDARACDHLNARIHQAAEARAASRGQPEPAHRSLSPGQADRSAGLEAGQ